MGHMLSKLKQFLRNIFPASRRQASLLFEQQRETTKALQEYTKSCCAFQEDCLQQLEASSLIVDELALQQQNVSVLLSAFNQHLDSIDGEIHELSEDHKTSISSIQKRLQEQREIEVANKEIFLEQSKTFFSLVEEFSARQERFSSLMEMFAARQEAFSSLMEDFSARQEEFSSRQEAFSSLMEDFSARQEDFSARQEEFSSRQEQAFCLSEQKTEQLIQENKAIQQELSATRLQIPIDRVLYADIKKEKRTFIDQFYSDMREFDNFESRYLKLTRGMDSESVETVVRIIKRVEAAAQSNEETLNVYSVSEQSCIREMWDHFDRNIIEISPNRYSCINYYLPHNMFNPSVLYYNHGMHTLKNVEALRDKDIIDAGAFIGDSAIALSPFTNRKVYSFEAIERNCVDFENTIAYNSLDNVVMERYALSDYTGTLEMYLSEDIDANSVIHRGDACEKTVTVACITVDDYVKEHNLEVGLIKTDVEGAEQALLRGARDTIIKFRPVLIISIYHTAEDFFEIKPIIESLGLNYTFRVYRPPMMNVLTDTLLIAE